MKTFEIALNEFRGNMSEQNDDWPCRRAGFNAGWTACAAEKDKRIKELEDRIEQYKSLTGCYIDDNSYSGPSVSYKELETELANVRSELELERECVDFYANQENWMRRYNDKTSAFIVLDTEDESDIEVVTGGHRIAGKRARQRRKERKG